MIKLFILYFNPIALRKAKIPYNFGLSECNMVNHAFSLLTIVKFYTVDSRYLEVEGTC